MAASKIIIVVKKGSTEGRTLKLCKSPIYLKDIICDPNLVYIKLRALSAK